jgi:hypothetical protein
VTPADGAPIEVTDGGQGAGGLATNGISPRPESAAVAPPASATEILDARTEFGQTITNPDGTYSLELSQERISFRNTAGDWQPIDLSLVGEVEGE